MIKKNDLAMIVLVISISLVASFFVGNALINTDDNRTTTVESVTLINPNFPQPSTDIFNDSAVNPTELIEIGSGGSGTPFLPESN
jgi:hypothetical protein